MYIGDIVMIVGDANNEYFIVTDFEDFSDEGNDTHIVFEVMSIFPISETKQVETFEGHMLKLVASYIDGSSRTIMEYVISQRIKAGYLEKPEYIILMESSLRVKYEQLVQEEEKMDKPSKIVSLEDSFDEINDEVHYERFGTVDEGLDTLIDLAMLFEITKDDKFLKARAVIESKIKELD